MMEKMSTDAYATAVRALLSLPPDELILTEAGWIMAHTHLGPGGSNTLLEDWQVSLMNDQHSRQWWGKARQVGWSWGVAGRALARAYLEPLRGRGRYTAVFLSINREEAQNKIRYAMEFWDSLSTDMQNELKLVAESRTYLEFSNGSRILSYPAKAVRGIAGADIYLDEFAHVPKAEEIYQGTTAATLRHPQAVLMMGSTPFGETGTFWRVGTDEAFSKTYRRRYVYWWDSAALCVNPLEARKRAVEEAWAHNRSRAAVEERVLQWGTEALKREYLSLPLEAFLQEFEVAFGAVTDALIPYDLIRAAMDPELSQEAITIVGDRHLEEVLASIDRALVRAGRDGVWAGYDPARRRDQAAIVAVALRSDNSIEVLGRWSLREVTFAGQEAVLERLLAAPVVHSLHIDITGGMGAPIQERLAMRWGEMRALGVNFSLQEKHQMASRVQAIFSKGALRMGGDRELATQIGTIRKVVLPTGKLRYEGGGEDHHADAFWALALALRGVPMETPTTNLMAATNLVGRTPSSIEVVGGGDIWREWREHLRRKRDWDL